ncbi:MAG: hypothetical protein IJI68_03670 [Eggerthellaceae bacterium]|nr:hypothetical protein [Eggerthellaceae bacterium]
MSEDNNREDLDPKAGKHLDGTSPEPPPSWKPAEPKHEQLYELPNGQDSRPENANPQPKPPSNTPIPFSESDAQLIEMARKYISISQICAVVSLFLGGIVLSTIAVILAFMGLSKINAYANRHSLEQSARLALRRPGVLALGMCVFALIFNIVSLIVLYPMVMQSLQSGDFSGLFGSGQGGASSGSSSSAWG